MARILHCPNCDAIIDESVFGTGNTVVCEYCKSVILLDPSERKITIVDDRTRLAREEYNRQQQEFARQQQNYEFQKKRWNKLNLTFIIVNVLMYSFFTFLAGLDNVFIWECCCSYSIFPTLFAILSAYNKPNPPNSKDTKVIAGFLLYIIHTAVAMITTIVVMVFIATIDPDAYDLEDSSTENNATTAVTTTEETTDNYSTYLKDGFYYIV